jgi:hypothetical protein
MSQQVTHRAGLDRSGPGLIYRSSLAFTRLARVISWALGAADPRGPRFGGLHCRNWP